MIDRVKTFVLCAVVVWGSVPAMAEQIIAIKADRIDTVASGVIENGVILIRDTKIAEVGLNVEIPDEAEVIDASDKTIFPGLINPASTMGLPFGRGGGSNPEHRVIDELYPHQHDYQRALQAGFTTLALAPSGGTIAGQGAIIRPMGQSLEEMVVAESGFLWINFQPTSGTKGTIRRALQSAKTRKESDGPDVAPLKKALSGQIPTFISCSNAAATIHLLDLLKEFKEMKPVLVVGVDNFHVAKELAKLKMPVVVRASVDFERFTRNRMCVPSMLARDGAKIACTPITSSAPAHEDFRRQMAELVKCGLDSETAKKAMTLHPAQAIGLDYRLGTIEKGKDANLLILDGDVLDIRTTIHAVMIEGKTVYENPWGKTQ